MKKIGIVLSTIFVMLLMVSTVSAVPYNEGSQTISNMGNINDNLEEFRDSENFLQLEQIADENFPHEYDQYMYDQLVSSLSSVVPQYMLDDDTFMYILIIIAEIIMLILGHNIIGQIAAAAVMILAIIPGALLLGSAAGLIVSLDELYALIDQLQINWDDMIDQWGILGAFIIELGIIVVVSILLIVFIPLNMILWICNAYIFYLSTTFDYIFSTTQQTEITQQEQQILQQAIMTLNQQTSEMILGATKGSSTSN